MLHINVSVNALLSREIILKTLILPSLFLSSVFISPALAQDAAAQDSAEVTGKSDETVFDGDFVTVGVGAGYGPSYDGSDDYRVIPAPVIIGSVDGYDFATRGPGLFVDLIKDQKDAKVDFIAGPFARVRLDRNSGIKDPVVKLLGERDVAVELGGSVGVEFNGALNPFDSVTFQTDILFDVAGAHSGTVISPSISYSTPLSTATFVSLTASTEWVDDDFADYYYSISPAGSTASGLPVFNAEGGFKSIGVSILGAYDLSGDVRDGGWGLFALGSYSKLQNDAAATPITSIRGDSDQWFGAAGINYTF